MKIFQKWFKNFTRAKLTYTKEMAKQDKLWDTASENLNTMAELQKLIVDEAISKGLKFEYQIYIYSDEESLCDIRFKGEDEWESFGYCKPLIEALENRLRREV